MSYLHPGALMLPTLRTKYYKVGRAVKGIEGRVMFVMFRKVAGHVLGVRIAAHEGECIPTPMKGEGQERSGGR